MWGISRGFVQIQDGGNRFRKDFWVHFATLERAQVFPLWNVMTKIVLKINCRDSNSPILAENLPFLENISGLSFSLNILLVLETLPSQRKIMFSLFNQSF